MARKIRRIRYSRCIYSDFCDRPFFTRPRPLPPLTYPPPLVSIFLSPTPRVHELIPHPHPGRHIPHHPNPTTDLPLQSPHHNLRNANLPPQHHQRVRLADLPLRLDVSPDPQARSLEAQHETARCARGRQGAAALPGCGERGRGQYRGGVYQGEERVGEDGEGVYEQVCEVDGTSFCLGRGEGRELGAFSERLGLGDMAWLGISSCACKLYSADI